LRDKAWAREVSIVSSPVRKRKNKKRQEESYLNKCLKVERF